MIVNNKTVTSLRCILFCIQEVTRAVNRQRATHRDITSSDNLNNDVRHLSLTSDVDSTDSHVKNDCLSASVGPSLGHQSHSALQDPQRDSTDFVSVSNTMTKVLSITPDSDCLVGCSVQNPVLEQSSPCTPNSAVITESSPAVNLKKTTPAGKITSYFGRAPSPPKTASEIAVSTSEVSDFVDALCGGNCERTTQCLECESVTHCTETFEDVEVIAQKAITHATACSTSDSDDDSEGEASTVVFICLCID